MILNPRRKIVIANPVQTTAFFRVEKGFSGDAVDEVNLYMIAAGIGTILI